MLIISKTYLTVTCQTLYILTYAIPTKILLCPFDRWEDQGIERSSGFPPDSARQCDPGSLSLAFMLFTAILCQASETGYGNSLCKSQKWGSFVVLCQSGPNEEIETTQQFEQGTFDMNNYYSIRNFYYHYNRGLDL